MLPSLVAKIEQHRSLQRDAAKIQQPKVSPPYRAFFRAEFASAKSPNFRPVVRPGFRQVELAKYGALDARKRGVLAKWSPTSNRFWVKNRNYRKQMIKSSLTGGRTAFRNSPAQRSTSHGGYFFPPQNLAATVIVCGVSTSKCALQHNRFPSALQDGTVEGTIDHHFSRIFLNHSRTSVGNYRFERAKNEFWD